MAQDRYVVALASGHRLARGPLGIAQFSGAAHVLTVPEGGEVGIADRALRKCGKRRHAQFRSGTGVGLDIACRAPGSGVPVDSQFMVSYYRDTNVGGSLGGYANVSGAAPFTTSNSWNSSGGPIGVQSLGLGAPA